MADKKIPIRTCVCCRKEFPKKDLLRVVRDKDGVISVDFTGKSNGRGAYICKDKACAEKLINKKILNKVFSCEIPAQIYVGLSEELLGSEQN